MGELREQRELMGQKGRGRARTKRRKKNTLNRKKQREHAWRTKKTGITIKTKKNIRKILYYIFVTDMVQFAPEHV